MSLPFSNVAGGAPGRWPAIVGRAGLAVASLAAAGLLVFAPAAGASTVDPASTTVLTTPGATASGTTGTSGAATSGGATTTAGGTTEVTVPGAGASALISDATPSSSTVPAGTGADSLLAPPKIRHGNTKTFAEKYGSGSYSLTEASSSTSASPTDGALGAVTDALWAMVTLLVGFAISVVQWAFHLDLANIIAPTLHQITGKLVQLIFDPWVATVVVVGAAWLVWWGLVRRRASIAGEGAVWMLVTLVVAIAFLAQPTSLLVGADHVTSSIGTSALSALAPITPSDSKVAGALTPSSAYKKGPASDAELRRTSNTIWDTYVYEPWLVAEFGSISVGTTAGPAWLALQANGGTVQAEQAVLGAQSTGAAGTGKGGIGAKQEGSNSAAGSTAGTSAGGSTSAAGSTSGTSAAPSPAAAGTATAATQGWFAGSYPAGRFGVVLVAFLAAAALCALLAALALAVLLAQVALVLLVALAPLFLLLGIHPGQGRRVALRWAELAVAAVLKRVVYAVALAAVLVVIGALIALMSAAGVGWAMTTLLPTLAMVALIVFRRRVIHALVGTGSAISLRAGAESARVLRPVAARATRQSTHARSPWARDAGPRHRPAAGGPYGDATGGTRPPWWAATRHPAPARGRPPAGQRPSGVSTGEISAEAGPEHQSDRDPAPVG